MKKKKVNLRDLEPKEHQGEHSHDDGHNHSSPEEISILSLIKLIYTH